MSDFQVIFGDFSATTVTFVANTTEAKERIYGGVSIQIKKSGAPEFFDKLLAEGFSIDC